MFGTASGASIGKKRRSKPMATGRRIGIDCSRHGNFTLSVTRFHDEGVAMKYVGSHETGLSPAKRCILWTIWQNFATRRKLWKDSDRELRCWTSRKSRLRDTRNSHPPNMKKSGLVSELRLPDVMHVMHCYAPYWRYWILGGMGYIQCLFWPCSRISPGFQGWSQRMVH